MTSFLSQPQKISLKHPSITAYQCDFSTENYTKAQAELLPIPFPATLARAVNKRQAEYFAARMCAYNALTDIDAESLLVGTGDKRQPLWPNTKQRTPIVGSITHSNDSAYCVVARKSDISHLGIDVEHHMTEKLADELKRTLINEEEEKRIRDIGLPFNQGLTLVFSAKETIFKTLFYDVGEYFGFEAAEFLTMDSATETLQFALTRRLASNWGEGTVLTINYQLLADHLLTYHFLCAE